MGKELSLSRDQRRKAEALLERYWTVQYGLPPLTYERCWHRATRLGGPTVGIARLRLSRRPRQTPKAFGVL